MKKYHITITNTEDNEVLVDTDTDAIIGAISEEEITRSIGFTSCNAVTLAATATGALQAVNEFIKPLPRWLVREIRKKAKE